MLLLTHLHLCVITGQPKPSQFEPGQEPKPVGEESQNEECDEGIPDSPMAQETNDWDQKMSEECDHDIEVSYFL